MAKYEITTDKGVYEIETEEKPKLKSVFETGTVEKIKKFQPLAAAISPIVGLTTKAMTTGEAQQGTSAFLNQRLLGLPEWALRKKGLTLGKPKTSSESLAEMVGGVAGAVTGGKGIYKLGKGLLGRFPGLASNVKFLPRVTKGAISGAGTAAAFTESEGTLLQPEERAKKAAIALPVGFAAEGIIGTTKEGLRFFRKRGKISGEENIKKITGRLGVKQKEITEEAKRSYEALKNKAKIETDYLAKEADRHIEDLDKGLSKKAEEATINLQPKIKEHGKKVRENYGKALDTIEDAMEKQGISTDNDSIIGLIKSTKSRIAEAELPINEQLNNALDALELKYRDLKTPQSLKNMLNDIRSIRSMLSGGAKKGTTGYTPDDVSIAIFNDEWGKYAVKNLPKEFQELQQAYGKQAELLKFANKVFKPYKGELESQFGKSFLIRVGKESKTITEPQRKALQALEKQLGTGYIKSVDDIGKRIEQIKKIKLNIPDAIAKKNELIRQQLKIAEDRLLGDIQKQIDRLSNPEFKKQVATKLGISKLDEITKLRNENIRSKAYRKYAKLLAQSVITVGATAYAAKGVIRF